MIPRYNVFSCYECYQASNEHQLGGTRILSLSVQRSLAQRQLLPHPASTAALLVIETHQFLLQSQNNRFDLLLCSSRNVQAQGYFVGMPVWSHSKDFHTLPPLFPVTWTSFFHCCICLSLAHPSPDTHVVLNSFFSVSACFATPIMQFGIFYIFT